MTLGSLPPCVAVSGPQWGTLAKKTTYLAKIALVLQWSPDKMLTFSQLMEKLSPLVCDKHKSVENTVRVCLSSNKCFVKVPLVRDSLSSKRNYWKVDFSHVTTKMVQRHFKEFLHFFPELSSKLETVDQRRASKTREAAAHITREEGKFSGPFSIESLLRRDPPSAGTPRVPALTSVQLPASITPTKRRFSWDAEELLHLQPSAGCSFVCSPGGSTDRSAINRSHMNSEYSFPVYSPLSTAPCYSQVSVPAATVTHNALCFRL